MYGGESVEEPSAGDAIHLTHTAHFGGVELTLGKGHIAELVVSDPQIVLVSFYQLVQLLLARQPIRGLH